MDNCELKQAVGLQRNRQLILSLRIDLFDLDGEVGPEIDHLWILAWITIVAQLGISIALWVPYSDWSIFLVTTSGTLFALLTGSLRQWKLEKCLVEDSRCQIVLRRGEMEKQRLN